MYIICQSKPRKISQGGPDSEEKSKARQRYKYKYGEKKKVKFSPDDCNISTSLNCAKLLQYYLKLSSQENSTAVVEVLGLCKLDQLR